MRTAPVSACIVRCPSSSESELHSAVLIKNVALETLCMPHATYGILNGNDWLLASLYQAMRKPECLVSQRRFAEERQKIPSKALRSSLDPIGHDRSVERVVVMNQEGV